MKISLWLLMIIMLLTLSGCNATPQGSRSTVVPTLATLPYAVGVTKTQLHAKVGQRRLPLTLWYPAQSYPAQTSNAAQGPAPQPKNSGIYISYYATADTKPAAGKFPLVLLSHGTKGTADSLLWIAEYLAGQGYWVVGVDHPDDSWPDATASGLIKVWDRPRDISDILTQLSQTPRFASYIDFTRVAALGHSSGGYTALALAGARYNTAQLSTHCASADAMPACALADKKALAKVDFSTAQDNYRDPRIKAVVSLAPAVVPALTTPSLNAIDIPVLLVVSEHDELLDNTPASATQWLPNVQLVSVSQVGHFVYLAECNSLGFEFAKQICTESVSGLRFKVHQQLQPKITAFLEQQLNTNQER